MSYNPAFVSDELQGNVANGSSEPQNNGGIILTSFKVLPKEERNASGGGSGSGSRKATGKHNKTLRDKVSQVEGNIKILENNINLNSNTNSKKHDKQQASNGLFVSTCSSLSLLDSQQSSNNSFNYSISDATTAATTSTNSSSKSNSSYSSQSSIIYNSSLCAAVECRDMRYDVGRGKNQKTILHNINVTVPEGSIYGLLGPSGCGKTTMLRCVVGRIKPKAGYVRVFGYRPNQSGSRIPGPAIGYMPQVSRRFKA